MQTLEIFCNETKVGNLQIFTKGRNESYAFSYDSTWLENGFFLDDSLPLSNETFYSAHLFPSLCDICPDRWGELIQKRAKARELSKSEYLIGVSDYFRIGALRVKQNNQFVSVSNDIPKLFLINELIESARCIERGESKELDIQRLLQPSGSLGGARPKASIIKDNELYIAKFQSLKDEDKQLVRLEKTMLDLAKICKINVCEAEIFSKNNAEVLLVKRFDREKNTRIPFKSAMTLLNVSENEGMNAQKSYVDIAKKLEKSGQKELFKRMLFNAYFANTDDHLRNHGLLLKGEKWVLSPAYDLTPEFIEPHKQYHALNFIDNENLAELRLFDKIKEEFSIDSKEFNEILKDIDTALNSAEKIARSNGLNSDNLKAFKKCLEHKDRAKFTDFTKDNLDLQEKLRQEVRNLAKESQKSKTKDLER